MRIAHENRRDIEIVKKIVSLSQLDLDTLREGDRLNLKEDLHALAVRGRVDKHKQEFLQQLTIEKIATIQENLFNWFEALAKGEKLLSWEINTPTKMAFAASDNINEPFDYQILAPDPVHTTSISLLFLLIRSGITPGRFRKCPECGSIFLLLRKPDKRNFYCSHRCAARVATRNSRRAKGQGGKRKIKTGGRSKNSKRLRAPITRGISGSSKQKFIEKPVRTIVFE